MNVLAAALNEAPALEDFGKDPLWMVLLKMIVLFVLLMVLTALVVWMERRLIGKMQLRKGPNRAGPFGLLQSLADGVKVGFKEEIIPTLVDKPVYFLAPVIVAIPAFLAFSVIPFGPTVSIFGTHTPLQLADLPVGVLVVLACSSMGVYGVVLAGWSSGSTYPLLGALRSSAQMISYEIGMGLSIVAVFLYAGSMSTSEIVAAQHDLWYILPLCVSAGIYFVSGLGETNRAPFDLAEAESELVGGYFTEYSSLKFLMFYLAEYINMAVVCSLFTTMFLGGWRAPWPLSLWDGANSGWWPMIWFLTKVVVLLGVFVWIRAALPRLRYDQFMAFGWKVVVPLALVWILFISTIRTLQRHTDLADWVVVAVVGGPVALVLLLMAFLPERRRDDDDDDGLPPAFPLPPMDLKVPKAPSLAHARGKAPAAVGAKSNRAARRSSTLASTEDGD